IIKVLVYGAIAPSKYERRGSSRDAKLNGTALGIVAVQGIGDLAFQDQWSRFYNGKLLPDLATFGICQGHSVYSCCEVEQIFCFSSMIPTDGSLRAFAF